MEICDISPLLEKEYPLSVRSRESVQQAVRNSPSILCRLSNDRFETQIFARVTVNRTRYYLSRLLYRVALSRITRCPKTAPKRNDYGRATDTLWYQALHDEFYFPRCATRRRDAQRGKRNRKGTSHVITHIPITGASGRTVPPLNRLVNYGSRPGRGAS